MKKLTQKQLDRILTLHENGVKKCLTHKLAKFNNVDLSFLNFRNRDLSYISFDNCNLTYTDFYNCCLYLSTFKNTDLTKAAFYSATLSFTQFDNVVLQDTNFLCASLQYTKLKNSDLSTADIDGAILNGITSTKNYIQLYLSIADYLSIIYCIEDNIVWYNNKKFPLEELQPLITADYADNKYALNLAKEFINQLQIARLNPNDFN